MARTEQQATLAAAAVRLTRNELATKRARARMWATREFERLVRDLAKQEPESAEAREVYRAELIAYLRHVSESLIQVTP